MLLEEVLGRAEPVGVGLSWLRGAAGFCVLEGLLPLPQPDPSRGARRILLLLPLGFDWGAG